MKKLLTVSNKSVNSGTIVCKNTPIIYIKKTADYSSAAHRITVLLFQMIFEVPCYCPHKVYPIQSAHIMLVVRINKIINKHLVLNALI